MSKFLYIFASPINFTIYLCCTLSCRPITRTVLLLLLLLFNFYFFQLCHCNWVHIFFLLFFCSYFIKLLIEKKYALPYRVLDAMVAHFVKFYDDSRVMPVIWHQSLLAFVQRLVLHANGFWFFFIFAYIISCSSDALHVIFLVLFVRWAMLDENWDFLWVVCYI